MPGGYFTPLRSPAYRFSRTWRQEQTLRVSDRHSAAARTQRRLSVPPRHLMLQRVVVGLVVVLCSLGVTIAVDADVRPNCPSATT